MFFWQCLGKYSDFTMKKWYGGLLIIALAMILVIRYSLITPAAQQQKQSPKQSAYGFFNPTATSINVTTEKVADFAQMKPRLITVVGLADLFNMTSVSDEEEFKKSLLVWAQMRELLSRSDTLPETAQGIKEASIAWIDLLSFLQIEKSFKLSNSSSVENRKECPSSVSTFDSNYKMSSNNSFNNSSSGWYKTVKIPCGLVEDSSITVVGIPHKHHGSFQIELVSSEIGGEPKKAPIILHYNVNLPSDDNNNKLIDEEPIIVQNTWIHDLGWGKEEKCPAHGNANTPKVDGLVVCNEQVIRSIEVNVSNPPRSGDNVSRAHTTNANFPFVGGNLFASTLSVGLEGFHMTVNGRHETSFAYREKLEPWLVSGVKITGGLDLLSVLAKDLPVYEDMVFDVEQLKAPPLLLAKKRIVMVIGVFSTSNNFERRMALRRSWMQYDAVRSGIVAVRFFIGLHKNIQVNIELWREAETYRDVQLMPFVDYYSLITLKTIAICIFGTKILPAKYIMKTDDDAFVRIDEVVASLKGKASKGVLNGMISTDSEPDRDKNSKWYISDEEWPQASYPPWAHGPGYIISRDIAKFIVRGHQERFLKLFKLEDVAMGIWIDQYKKSGQEVNYMNDERFHNVGCESDYVLAHYQSPRLLLCLWEKLQKEKQPICCE